VRTLSIRFKLVFAIFPLLLVAGGGLLFSVHERSIAVASKEALEAGARLYADLEAADIEKLSATLDALSEIEGLKRSFVARDRSALAAQAVPLFEQLEERYRITHWYFLEPEPSRKCFLRVHKPGLFGDKVERATLSKAIFSRRIGAGKEVGKTAFALRVVKPYTDGGRIVGYMELGEEMDHFLARMKELTGDDYALLLSKKHLDEGEWAALRERTGRRNDWGDLSESVVVDATVSDPELVQWTGTPEALLARGEVLAEVTRQNHTLMRGVHPVMDAAGRAVGALLVFHDITEIHDGMIAGRLGSVGIIVGLLMFAALILLALVERLVFRRLRRVTQRLEEASRRIAAGDYSAGDEVVSVADDEVGQFEAFVGRFLESIRDTVRALEARNRKPG
jgi:HAMP domain-containing protein